MAERSSAAHPAYFHFSRLQPLPEAKRRVCTESVSCHGHHDLILTFPRDLKCSLFNGCATLRRYQDQTRLKAQSFNSLAETLKTAVDESADNLFSGKKKTDFFSRYCVLKVSEIIMLSLFPYYNATPASRTHSISSFSCRLYARFVCALIQISASSFSSNALSAPANLWNCACRENWDHPFADSARSGQNRINKPTETQGPQPQTFIMPS